MATNYLLALIFRKYKRQPTNTKISIYIYNMLIYSLLCHTSQITFWEWVIYGLFVFLHNQSTIISQFVHALCLLFSSCAPISAGQILNFIIQNLNPFQWRSRLGFLNSTGRNETVIYIGKIENATSYDTLYLVVVSTVTTILVSVVAGFSVSCICFGWFWPALMQV